MDQTAERRAVATAVFAATGKKVDDDDPIIVAALFQAYTMREASRNAASQIAEAGGAVKLAVEDARVAIDEVGVLVRQLSAGEKARSRSLEALVKKAIRDAGKVQSSQEGPPTGWRGVLGGVAFGIVIAIGAVSVASGFSFSWVSDARLGAEFKRAVPTLEPSLRKKLVEHLEKQRT